MSKEKTVTLPFDVGDEVKFWMANWHKFTGVIECVCTEWVKFKDGMEIRLGHVMAFKLIKEADIANEAQEFLAKEKCPSDEGKNDQRKKKRT